MEDMNEKIEDNNDGFENIMGNAVLEPHGKLSAFHTFDLLFT